jgi:hypothetical protein
VFPRKLNVQAARREGLAKDIAAFTGLSLTAARGRLKRAHGRSLLRNIFADVWPEEGSLAAATPGPTARKASPGKRPAAATRTIHRVRQEFSTSCGVAVVAMFARVSHEEAMAVLFPKGGRVFYTYLYQLKRALDHFGVKYGPRLKRFSSWDDIPTTSLVKVKPHGESWSHWVVFQRKRDGGRRVIDPDPGRPGTQTLARDQIEQYRGVTYLLVDAVLPEDDRRPR